MARAEADTYSEARALADLVAITHRLGDVWGLIAYAESAWQAAESNCYWDQLARLATVFGDIAYAGQDYQRCFDHYANACAFAGTASAGEYRAILDRIDQVLAELLAQPDMVEGAFSPLTVALVKRLAWS